MAYPINSIDSTTELFIFIHRETSWEATLQGEPSLYLEELVD
jgi:hypothetical protein